DVDVCNQFFSQLFQRADGCGCGVDDCQFSHVLFSFSTGAMCTSTPCASRACLISGEISESITTMSMSGMLTMVNNDFMPKLLLTIIMMALPAAAIIAFLTCVSNTPGLVASLWSRKVWCRCPCDLLQALLAALKGSNIRWLQKKTGQSKPMLILFHHY